MNTRVKGFIYLLLSAVYFGFMPLLVKVICADGSTIVGALFLRFALAIIPLFSILAAFFFWIAARSYDADAARVSAIAVDVSSGTTDLVAA